MNNVKINYDKLMQKRIDEIKRKGSEKPGLLLHSCCGPCSTSVIERLVEDFDVTIFFYNPNIDDENEYELRKANQIKYIKERYGAEECEGQGIPHEEKTQSEQTVMQEQNASVARKYRNSGEKRVFFLEGRYNVEAFYEFAENLADEKEGGQRCICCFEFRLREAAKTALLRSFDFFSTTLTVSPMKNSDVINKLGVRIGEETGVEYLVSDFKKRGGYQRSIELSKEYDLYRQHFCGCSFGKNREMNCGKVSGEYDDCGK